MFVYTHEKEKREKKKEKKNQKKKEIEREKEKITYHPLRQTMYTRTQLTHYLT